MESRRHVFVAVACCLVALAACQKPTANPPTSTGPAAPVAVEAPVSGGESPAPAPVFRLSSVAVDCTSAVVFAPLTPDSDIFMRDACDDLSGVTIGLDGQEISLERIGGLPRPGDTRLRYQGAGYQVEISGQPGFWLAMGKGEETRTGCREYEERVEVGISQGARTLAVPSRMTARCP